MFVNNEKCVENEREGNDDFGYGGGWFYVCVNGIGGVWWVLDDGCDCVWCIVRCVDWYLGNWFGSVVGGVDEIVVDGGWFVDEVVWCDWCVCDEFVGYCCEVVGFGWCVIWFYYWCWLD